MITNDQLIERALGSFEPGLLERWYTRTWVPFGELLDAVLTTSLQSGLQSTRASDLVVLDGWTTPDAIWQGLCERDPGLAVYPMGEIAERAVKKVVASLLVHQRREGGLPREDETAANLVKHVREFGTGSLATLLAAFFLFEACVERLRRFSEPLESDTGYWYQFRTDGRLMPLDLQMRVRWQILEQCMQMARDYSCHRELQLRSTTTIKANVVASGKPLAELRRICPVVDDPLRLMLHTESANVAFDVDRIAQELAQIRSRDGPQADSGSKSVRKSPLGSLSRDFLDLGAVVYMADIQVKRNRNLDRELGILLPVRDAAGWDKASREVERTIAFLGRDEVKLFFIGRKEPRVATPALVASAEPCVCLFSGGLDSLAGAVWALDRGLTPVLVSHYASRMLGHVQTQLAKSLGRIYNCDLPHIGVMVGSRSAKGVRHKLPSPPKSPMAQHLRSFMFLSIATAVALELGIDRIYVFENGPIALNPLVSEARVNTRTAHPRFLEMFSRLIHTVSGVNIQIENPFLYWTKGEITKLLAREEVSGLLAQTISCWKWFIVPLMAHRRDQGERKDCRHDGECIPCLIRRASVHRAGLEDRDAPYLFDVLEEFPTLSRETPASLRKTATAIADYLRFNQMVLSLSDAGLLIEAPDFSVCADGVDCRRLVDMYRRHSKEMLDFVRDRAGAHFLDVFAAAVGKPT